MDGNGGDVTRRGVGRNSDAYSADFHAGFDEQVGGIRFRYSALRCVAYCISADRQCWVKSMRPRAAKRPLRNIPAKLPIAGS